MEKEIVVGKVANVHGLKGDVKILSFTHDPQALFELAPVMMGTKILEKWPKARPTSNERIFLVSLGASREEVALLKGQELKVWRRQLPAEEEGIYYIDLIGREVIDGQGKKMGSVKFVHNFGAGDILEIQGEKDDAMVSFHEVEKIHEEKIYLKKPSSSSAP